MVKNFLATYKTTVICLIIYSLLMSIATFAEKYYGTTFALKYFYHSKMIFALLLLMIVNLILCISKKSFFKNRRWGLLLSHYSFIIILIGALVTHIFGEEGYIHLREGESSDKYMLKSKDGEKLANLPFDIKLIKFELKKYPGSNSPSSYESDVEISLNKTSSNHKIFMNNVLDVKGYRLFQGSYDIDNKGSILLVNRDVYGRYITYCGYFFLFIGLIICMFAKGGRIRFLLNKINKVSLLIIFLAFSSNFSFAINQDDEYLKIINDNIIDEEHADKFGSLLVLSSSGRIMPINTFSSQILRKIYRSEKFGNMNSDQFLISLISLPEIWIHVPFINLGNNDILAQYGIETTTCSYMDLFYENGNYKLEEKINHIYSKIPAERDKTDKELLKLDEKINILHQLFDGKYFNIFPKQNDINNNWYSSNDDLSGFDEKDSLFISKIMLWYKEEIYNSIINKNWETPDQVLEMINTYQKAKNTTLSYNSNKIRLEKLYNKLNIFRFCKTTYLIIGALFLIITLISFFRKINNIRYISNSFICVISIIFLFHTIGIGLRWLISGYAPWSNSYETMVYISWITILAGLIIGIKNHIIIPLSTLFAGVILFVSGLNWMDPHITPLVPVLKSPWLMFHVAVIVSAYGFFGISMFIGLTNIILMSFINPSKILKNKIKELTILNEISMIFGLCLMTIGTFLGAIWANESWGRYWGWDPKETWALITMIVYAIVSHMRFFKIKNTDWFFNGASVISFFSVIMTFFGVNYFLSGMHSYGNTGSSDNMIYIALIVLIALFVMFYYSYNKNIQNKIITT